MDRSSPKILPPTPPRTETSRGELCVVDWCVEIAAVSPQGYRLVIITCKCNLLYSIVTYAFISLLPADTGGMLGLCIGGSLLTVVEICELILLLSKRILIRNWPNSHFCNECAVCTKSRLIWSVISIRLSPTYNEHPVIIGRFLCIRVADSRCLQPTISFAFCTLSK